MKPSTCRRIFLAAPLALLGVAFFLSSVHGQRFPRQPLQPIRPPIIQQPPMPRPPTIQPPVIQPINPNPGMPGMNPNPGMPNINPPMIGPQTMETVWTCSRCGKELGRNTAAPPSRCPHCGARLMNGVGPDPGPPTPSLPSLFSSSSSSSDSSTTSTTPRSKVNGKLIALIAGIVVIGICALLGGTWLVIYTMKSGSAPASRRRRSRRDDDDDYDD